MIDSPRRRGAAPLDAVGTNNGSRIEARIASSHLPRLIPLRCFGVAWRGLSRDSNFFSRADTIKRPLHRLETRLIAKRARERREEGCAKTLALTWTFEANGQRLN